MYIILFADFICIFLKQVYKDHKISRANLILNEIRWDHIHDMFLFELILLNVNVMSEIKMWGIIDVFFSI